MYLYCERVTYKKNDHTQEIILDFYCEKNIKQVSNLFNIKFVAENQTILVLNGVRYKKYKGFRSDNWYKLSLDFFRKFNLIDENPDNSRMLAELIYNSQERLNLQPLRQLEDKEGEKLFIEHSNDTLLFNKKMCEQELQDIDRKNHDNLNLIVRDVGCGNWNEIIREKFWLIYDLGGDIKYNDKQMRDIFKRIKFDKEFLAFISHWDLDHYRAILDLKKMDLNKMKYIIVPSKQPNTLQKKKH